MHDNLNITSHHTMYIMEYNFCWQSQDNCHFFWVEIMEIGSSPFILYELNNGKRLPSFMVRYFTYDLLSITFQAYYLDNWRNITIEDIECLVWHPSMNHSFVNITWGRLPFGNPVNSVMNVDAFASVKLFKGSFLTLPTCLISAK